MSVDSRKSALKNVWWIERDKLGIAKEFHDALSKYAIAKGYELNPQTLQVAQYFNNEWEMCIREGKKYANKGRDGSGYHIRQYDY